MIEIPDRLASATTPVRVERFVTLTFPRAVYRYTDGPRARDGFDHDAPVRSLEIPRVDGTLSNRELVLALLDPDGDWRDRVEYVGIGAIRVEVHVSVDGAALAESLRVFVGRGSGFSVSPEFVTTFAFTSGFGQITARRSIVASDADLRARARADDSLAEIGIRPVRHWGERV